MKPALTSCSKCKARVLSHRVCYNCGTYKGRVVIDVLAKLSKKEKKQKEKELAAREKEQRGGGTSTSKEPLSLEELSRK